MKVKNRQGQFIAVSYDAIKHRITRLCTEEELEQVDIDGVIIQTINGIYDGISTSELDNQSARVCASLQSTHYMYDVIAARIVASNMAKNVRTKLLSLPLPLSTMNAEGDVPFSVKVAYVAAKCETLSPAFVAYVARYAPVLDAMIKYERNATNHTYFSLRTLERSYLISVDGLCVESPQDMWMRVAVAIHGVTSHFYEERDAMKSIQACYEAMSTGQYTHATPTLFNAGMRVQQCSSCFVADTEVLTVNAGVKKIQDVVIGDMVITHKGNVRPVTQLHCNPLGDRLVHRLKVASSKEVFVTGNHRFWAVRKGAAAAAAAANADAEPEPSWVPAEDLQIGDYVGAGASLAHLEMLDAVRKPEAVEPLIVGGDQTFMRVQTNDPMPEMRPEFVYTLGVEEDHSYAVEGLLAENCYLLGTADDLSGIYETLADCAQISKWAGGIGLHVSNVRAKGTTIKSTNGTSDGIIPMLQVYNATARYCNQSGKRKGSIAIYLEPWHADVWEFVELRRNVGAETERARDLFLALWVPDEFMERLERDDDWYLMSHDTCPGLIDAVGKEFSALYNRYVSEGRYVKSVKARALWQHIIACQLETGTPYIMYKDHVNRKCNQSNVGTIRSSNLCVAPETHILTSSGYHPISSLEGKVVKVWNGKEFSETVVHKTGVDQPLIKVSFSNGEDIECTPYHKFNIGGNESKVVEAKDLQDGDVIAKYSMPVVPDEELLSGFKYPYTHGMFCATGTLRDNKPILYLFNEMESLAEYLDKEDGTAVESDYQHKSIVRLPLDIAQMQEVPINYVMSEKLRWLEGIVDAHNRILKTAFGDAIELSNEYMRFLVNVKRMLNTMGIDPKIRSSFMGYCLIIDPVGVAKLVELGFSPKRLSLEGVDSSSQPQSDTRRYVVITDVSDNGRRDDTYCFTEPLEGKGVFNGILSFNCAEITQYSDENEYGVCNLASISIPKHINSNGNTIDHAALHETARQITYNLNKLIDMNDYPTPKADRSNKALRPIGIGLQGLGDVYCMLKLPYDDPRALQVDEEVMETIYHGAMTGSVELAVRDGPYPRFEGSPASRGLLQMDLWGHVPKSGRYDWDAMRDLVKKFGLRNSLLTALMPTASTSQVLGNCESFEPFQSNVFKRSTLAGEFLVVNRHLMKDLMNLGMWNEDMRKEIIKQDGSLQNIAGIPELMKRVYATVWEVPQRAVIDHSAARGPYVDQSQSMNLYMLSPSFQKLSRALIYAWQKGLKTGLYYLRSAPAKEAVKVTGNASGVGIKRGASVSSVPAHAPALAPAHAPASTPASEEPGNAADAEAEAEEEAVMVCKMRRAGDDGVCEMCSA